MSATRASDVTLVKGAIHNPDEPRHFMEIDATPRSAAAYIDGVCVAQTTAPRIAREVGRSVYDPVVYFPRSDVIDCRLTATRKVTHCPLKGQATYYNITVNGRTFENAAWSYDNVLDFDPRLADIEGYIGFTTDVADIISSRLIDETQPTPLRAALAN